MPTSSLASFSRRKPCTSRFAVLCRWPTITPSFWCGTFPLAAQVAKHGSRPTQQCSSGIRRMQPWILSKHNKLLRMLCTLPITSAECERSFSTLPRLKTYVRATMTSERESGLALMNIHYGRQIGIGGTIDIFAPKHPRLLLLSDILAEWTVNHKSTAFDEVCNMLNNYYILLRSISSGSEIYNPLLEIPATFGAEIIGNLCSESRKRHFWRHKIQKFSGESCPRTPVVKSTSGIRLSIGQAIYIRNPSMQKGWLRP